MAFTLHLIGPISQTSHTVTHISATTMHGDITIHENHAPMIAQLAPHHEIVYTLEDQSQEHTQLVGGIMHVERDTVTIIMDI